jgi:hypothetical protein
MSECFDLGREHTYPASNVAMLRELLHSPCSTAQGAARSRDKVAGGALDAAAPRHYYRCQVKRGGAWQTRDRHHRCQLGTIRTGAGRRPDGRRGAITNLSTARA